MKNLGDVDVYASRVLEESTSSLLSVRHILIYKALGIRHPSRLVIFSKASASGWPTRSKTGSWSCFNAADSIGFCLRHPSTTWDWHVSHEKAEAATKLDVPEEVQPQMSTEP